MTWLCLSDTSLAWTLEAARIGLVVFGCAAGGWAIGFAMGYRRGVNDAIGGALREPDHRLNGDKLLVSAERF
jgi:hypothetical protein